MYHIASISSINKNPTDKESGTNRSIIKITIIKITIMKGNKYGRKYTTQTIVTYENNRLVTKTIIHSKGQQKREINVDGTTQW